MSTKLIPGPELDAAVAKACGIEGTLMQFKSVGVLFVLTQGDLISVDERYAWQPSKDLNAAFEAAEKFGLFDGWMLYKAVAVWGFQDAYDSPLRNGDCVLEAPTPALAICAAILEINLKGPETQS